MYSGLEKVFNFLNAAPGSRSVVEGEAVLHAKHLVVCRILQKSSETREIIAYCVQTSAINQDPHEIKGNLNNSGSVVDVRIFLCSCKARTTYFGTDC